MACRNKHSQSVLTKDECTTARKLAHDVFLIWGEHRQTAILKLHSDPQSHEPSLLGLLQTTNIECIFCAQSRSVLEHKVDEPPHGTPQDRPYILEYDERPQEGSPRLHEHKSWQISSLEKNKRKPKLCTTGYSRWEGRGGSSSLHRHTSVMRPVLKSSKPRRPPAGQTPCSQKRMNEPQRWNSHTSRPDKGIRPLRPPPGNRGRKTAGCLHGSGIAAKAHQPSAVTTASDMLHPVPPGMEIWRFKLLIHPELKPHAPRNEAVAIHFGQMI